MVAASFFHPIRPDLCTMMMMISLSTPAYPIGVCYAAINTNLPPLLTAFGGCSGGVLYLFYILGSLERATSGSFASVALSYKRRNPTIDFSCSGAHDTFVILRDRGSRPASQPCLFHEYRCFLCARTISEDMLQVQAPSAFFACLFGFFYPQPAAHLVI